MARLPRPTMLARPVSSTVAAAEKVVPRSTPSEYLIIATSLSISCAVSSDAATGSSAMSAGHRSAAVRHAEHAADADQTDADQQRGGGVDAGVAQ